MPRKLTLGDRRGAKPGRVSNVPHEKTEVLSHKVKMLRALGNSYEAIALACDFSVDTLTRHYTRELEIGKMEANNRVGSAIHFQASGEPEFDAKTGLQIGWKRTPDNVMAIWWSKNMMGWSDSQRIEHSGEGGPMLTEQRSSADQIKARLEAIRARSNKAA